MATTPDLQSPILMVNLEGWELELQHVLPPTLHQCAGCSHAQGVLRQMGRDKAFHMPPEVLRWEHNLDWQGDLRFRSAKGRP